MAYAARVRGSVRDWLGVLGGDVGMLEREVCAGSRRAALRRRSEWGGGPLDADFAVNGFDVGVEGVGRQAEAVGELFFAVFGIESAEDDPFALGEAFEGWAEDFGVGLPGEHAAEELGELGGGVVEDIELVGGEAGGVGGKVDGEQHAGIGVDAAAEDQGAREGGEIGGGMTW